MPPTVLDHQRLVFNAIVSEASSVSTQSIHAASIVTDPLICETGRLLR